MTDNFQQFTRKEVVGWVQGETRYKFDELRNGVFFCRMLCAKFPEEAHRIKYNPSPVSNYDCTSNLNQMKKLLNRKGLQLNLNVSEVAESKNNFELARWFKNLLQGNVSLGSTIGNLSLPPRPSLPGHRDKAERIRDITTPRKSTTALKSEKAHKVESAEKPKKTSSSKEQRLSMAKSSTSFFKDKDRDKKLLTYGPDRPVLPLPLNKSNSRKSLRGESSKIIHSQGGVKKEMAWQESQNDIQDQFYERALEESIESLQRILERVQEAVNRDEAATAQAYRDSIRSAIFGK